MRAVVQRVSRAQVRVGGEELGRIGEGLLVLLGIAGGDGPAEVEWMVRKVAELRVFPDGEGRMNRSIAETGGGVLVVSQFTLFGDVRKGRRPSYVGAAPPETAEPLVEAVRAGLEARGVPAAAGRFRAMMDVELVNQGPVTLILDSPVRTPRTEAV
jgi:D-tyrosyl-tRNA(Tyr) deacylase